jgi:hypothetical protein
VEQFDRFVRLQLLAVEAAHAPRSVSTSLMIDRFAWATPRWAT